jgi:hypothetical protein
MEKSMRPILAAIILALALGSGPAEAEPPHTATLYKDPQCRCCEAYADYLRENGFEVAVSPTIDLPAMKRQYEVPGALAGCHTTLIEGYVVEGHVPIGAVLRMLTERPAIKGISLPGMPEGSPGMSGAKAGPFTTFQFGGGEPKVYAIE